MAGTIAVLSSRGQQLRVYGSPYCTEIVTPFGLLFPPTEICRGRFPDGTFGGIWTLSCIEAYGVKGPQCKLWKRKFKSVEALNKWAKKNDAEVYGTRTLEGMARTLGDNPEVPK